MLSLGRVKESPKEEKLMSRSCCYSTTLTVCMDLSMQVQKDWERVSRGCNTSKYKVMPTGLHTSSSFIVNPHHRHDLALLLFQPQILTVRWPCSTWWRIRTKWRTRCWRCVCSRAPSPHTAIYSERAGGKMWSCREKKENRLSVSQTTLCASLDQTHNHTRLRVLGQ